MNKLRELNSRWIKDLNLPDIKPAVRVLIYELSLPSESKMLAYTPIVDNGRRDVHALYVGQVIKQIVPDTEFYASTGFLTPDIDKTIDFCIANNIKIINVSATVIETEQGNQAIKRFADWGGIVCAAAGNKAGGKVAWPANSPFVIAVSATNTPDCDGPEIDVTVPSHWKVYQISGALHDFDGTSAATPAMAACVAIILAVHPEWKVEEVRAFLQGNSTPGPEEYERTFRFPDGFGKEGNMEHRKKTTRLVLHHSASAPSTTKEQVDQWHRERGFAMIGYHYFIEQDGAIKVGRPDWAVGAHAIGANNDSLGICLAGNFETAPPTTAQMESLAALIKRMRNLYGNLPVIGHKDVDPAGNPTACPGKLFPWVELPEALRKEEKSVDDIKGRWSEQDIKLVVSEGLMKGYPDGTFKPEQPVTREELAAVLARIVRKGG